MTNSSKWQILSTPKEEVAKPVNLLLSDHRELLGWPQKAQTAVFLCAFCGELIPNSCRSDIAFLIARLHLDDDYACTEIVGEAEGYLHEVGD